MKKALITGASGFVGPYLRSELEDQGYDVSGVDRSGGCEFQADLLNKVSLLEVMKKVSPDFIYHLAGFSSVKDSYDNPELCRQINVEGTKNLLESVREVNSSARVLIVTSAHVYGAPKYNPIDEDHSLNPNSPYAESRVEQEELSLASGLDVVISRSFNHTGPGQQLGFVCPDFINEVQKIVTDESSTMKVGNLSAKRDVSDVRDVVRAYRILLETGKSREIYNICSGQSIEIQEILDTITEIAGIEKCKIVRDSAKMRPVDVPEMFGSNVKIRELGWKPRIQIRQTLEDMWKHTIG